MQGGFRDIGVLKYQYQPNNKDDNIHKKQSTKNMEVQTEKWCYRGNVQWLQKGKEDKGRMIENHKTFIRNILCNFNL